MGVTEEWNDEMFQKFSCILQAEAQIAPDQLDPSMTLADLNVASVDMVMIVFRIEEEFDVELPVEEIDPNMQLRDLARLVAQKMQTSE
jgi:acyl carrier protein